MYRLAICLLFVVCSLPVAAFTEGEIYVYGNNVDSKGAVIRVDPLTGAEIVLNENVANWAVGTNNDRIEYDPFRDRLIVTVYQEFALFSVSDTGMATKIWSDMANFIQPQCLAARGDGIVYLAAGTGGFLYFLDAWNDVHPLLDMTGTHINLENGDVWAATYDSGTNALFVFFRQDVSQDVIGVKKIPLDAAGGQASGPIQAFTLPEADPGVNEEVQGLGRLPSGEILVVIDSNSSNPGVRFQTVDPVTTGTGDYASIGGCGSGGLYGGTYSTVRGQALYLRFVCGGDRSWYAIGQGGAEGVIAPVTTFSGTQPSMVEIPPALPGTPAGAVEDDAAPNNPVKIDRAESGDLTINWGVSCTVGDSDYTIYEGTLGDFTSHLAVACSTGDTTTSTFPPSEDSSYYLVVPHNGTREGSYGSDSAGTERPNSAAPCHARLIEDCP